MRPRAPAGLVAALCLPLAPGAAAAQHASIGPALVVGDYREVSSTLRYNGVGPGVDGTITFHRFTADGAFGVIRMNPASGSGATANFQATEVDAWLRWDGLSYLGLEVGLVRRTANSEFAAQSVGAVRVGARTQHLLGPGVRVWARGDYLAGAQFSGGGSAPFALELGLGLDVELGHHVRAAAAYSFERLDRKTNPGGGAEVSVPIEQALARVGVAVAL